MKMSLLILALTLALEAPALAQPDLPTLPSASPQEYTTLPITAPQPIAAPKTASHPYFRIFDVHHPEVNVGACTDPVNVGHSQQCTVVAIITHSSEDGYFLIPGEDWSPLGIGYAASGEGASLVITPSFNVIPLIGEAVKLSRLKLPSLGFSGSFGPAFVYDPFYGRNGKGYFRLFAGAAWKF